MRNADFLRVFIWQHNFQRYLTPIFEHRQPFWFFSVIFAAAILPYLPLLLSTITGGFESIRSPEVKNSPALFIGCWVLFTLMFFSASQSKLPGYILPAIPPAVLLLCASTAKCVQKKSAALLPILACVGLIFPVGVGIGLAQWNHASNIGTMLHGEIARGIQIALAAAIVFGGLIVAYSLRRKFAEAVFMASLATAFLLLLANRLILPGTDTIVSSRPAAIWAIQGHSIRADELAVYRLPRAYQYGLNYYFGGTLQEWTPENNSARFLFCSREALNSVGPANISEAEETPVTGDGNIFFIKLNARQGK